MKHKTICAWRAAVLFCSWSWKGLCLGMVAALAAAEVRAQERCPGATHASDEARGTSSALRPLAGSGLSFAENLGQWDTSAEFVSHRKGAILRAEQDGLWIELRRPGVSPDSWDRLLLRFQFEGAANDAVLSGEAPAAWRHNYFLGDDPRRWKSGVRVYESLRWKELWPGIDLIVGPGAPGQVLEYRFEVEPEADLDAITIRVEGADTLGAASNGRLTIETGLGPVWQTRPRAFEMVANGTSHEVGVSFSVLGADRFGFSVADRDQTRPLLIDPGLLWGTYLGGSLDDLPLDVVLDEAEQPLVVGRTWSLDFPTTAGAYEGTKTFGSGFDVFVSRMTSDGSALVFSTYLGGSGFDMANAVEHDSGGRIVVGGHTASADFPVTPEAYDTAFGGGSDVFVAMLSSDGSQLRFSTYLGGQDAEGLGEGSASGGALTLAANGDIFVGGRTESADFPITAGALFPTYVGLDRDGFLARLSAKGDALLWSTFLPGNNRDDVTTVDLASDGSVVVGGYTESHDFPSTASAFDPVFDAATFISAYVMKLAPDGAALLFSTFLHGSCGEYLYALHLDSDDRIAFTGYTCSSDMPVTPNAFDPAFGPGRGYAAVLSSDGTFLEYSTFLAGLKPESEGGAAIHLADSGVLTILSTHSSGEAPLSDGAYDVSKGLSTEFHVLRIDPHGTGLLYASYLGGDFTSDLLYDGVLDSLGRAVVIGSTCCTDGFPLIAGGLDTVFGGYGPAGWFYGDGVVAKLDLQPFPGVATYGSSTPACLGLIHLTALGDAKAGNANFAVACAGAPPGALGATLVGAGAAAGLPLLGVSLYIDPSLPMVVLPAVADAVGYDIALLPLPLTAAGLKVYLQSGWLDTGGCGAPLSFSASSALAITVGAP